MIDLVLSQYLATFGAVSVEGPKWCGKTSIAMMQAKSCFDLADASGNFANRFLADNFPSMVLEGEKPRLIDEWQEVPKLWDAVRYSVDHADEPGQFLLSGSSVPNRDGIMHSGAGRIARLRMRPMSLYESGESSGDVSVQDLFAGAEIATVAPVLSMEEITGVIVRGGWPYAVTHDSQDKTIIPRQYLDAIINDDAMRMGIEIRSKSKFKALIGSLGRNESTAASLQTIAKDLSLYCGEPISWATVNNYTKTLEMMYFVDNQKAFIPRVRSSMRFKRQDKRHLADPSLAAAVLGLTPEKLASDRQTLVFLFEALAERDLRIYAEALGGSLYHYQDYASREIDAVIVQGDGRWGGFEIKLSRNSEDEAASSLLRVRDALRAAEGTEPSFLCVLCGFSGVAYRRKDGVYSVPLDTLRP